MACTGEIWYKQNKVNECNVYFQGRAKRIGKTIIGKHDNLRILISPQGRSYIGRLFVDIESIQLFRVYWPN
jgi:hypothetical protein